MAGQEFPRARVWGLAGFMRNGRCCMSYLAASDVPGEAPSVVALAEFVRRPELDGLKPLLFLAQAPGTDHEINSHHSLWPG